MADSLTFKERTHEIIFETGTRAGRIFDITLIIMIVTSVAVVMLDSVASVREAHGPLLYGIEWFFTIAFTIEYILRLYSVGKPMRYATSFYGIVDLLAILPTYIGLFVGGTHYLVVIRDLRMLRIFRVLKVTKYLREMELLRRALLASRGRIMVFIFAVLLIAIIAGSLMYVVEGPEHGYTSIPKGVYWAIVTMTTVGYGDISPDTPLGQLLATGLMILGYGIIAVPTGIVTAEMTKIVNDPVLQSCPACAKESYQPGAIYCAHCAAELNPTPHHNDGTT